jgi:hypothetical protein
MARKGTVKHEQTVAVQGGVVRVDIWRQLVALCIRF